MLSQQNFMRQGTKYCEIAGDDAHVSKQAMVTLSAIKGFTANGSSASLLIVSKRGQQGYCARHSDLLLSILVLFDTGIIHGCGVAKGSLPERICSALPAHFLSPVLVRGYAMFFDTRSSVIVYGR